MADAIFAQRLGLNGKDAELAVSIRRVISLACGVESEFIHDTGDTLPLNEIMLLDVSGGWDEVVFCMRLEEELRITVPDEVRLPSFVGKRFFLCWHERPPASFGNWTVEMVKLLKRVVPASRQD
jgi:hypothetical protein